MKENSFSVYLGSALRSLGIRKWKIMSMKAAMGLWIIASTCLKLNSGESCWGEVMKNCAV